MAVQAQVGLPPIPQHPFLLFRPAHGVLALTQARMAELLLPSELRVKQIRQARNQSPEQLLTIPLPLVQVKAPASTSLISLDPAPRAPSRSRSAPASSRLLPRSPCRCTSELRASARCLLLRWRWWRQHLRRDQSGRSPMLCRSGFSRETSTWIEWEMR